MGTDGYIDALVLGSGPGALSIAAALAMENLKVEILSPDTQNEPWPYTYGIWGEEVDELELDNLLEHRWTNTVSFFGEGAHKSQDIKNRPTKHKKDYGLFDKKKLQERRQYERILQQEGADQILNNTTDILKEMKNWKLFQT